MSPHVLKCLRWLAAVSLSCGVAAAMAAEPVEQLDEIVVTATQAKIRELRMAAEKAEDAFYARYNEINKNHDFDINCHVEKEGLFRQHRCTGAYIERAQQADASGALAAAKNCGPGGVDDFNDLMLHGGCGFIPMADVIEAGRKKDFALNLLRTINSDPQLQQLARDRENIGAQFVKVRARLFGKDGARQAVPATSP